MKRKRLLLAVALVTGMLGWNSAQAQEEITSQYLTNADLKNLTGWTTSGYTDWKTDGAVPVVEFWNWSTQFSFTQTITLPAGDYRLAVNSFYRESWGGDGTNNDKAWIFAGEKKQNVAALSGMSELQQYSGSNDLYRAATAFSQGKYSNAFDFTIDTDNTDITIGFAGTTPNGGWCILGPVKLYKYSLDDYLDDYLAKVAEAEALYDSPMNADVLTALKAAVVDKSTFSLSSQVTAAIQTLTTAINNANTSIAKYVTAKGYLDKASTLDAAGQAVYASNDAVTALQSAYNDRSLVEVTADQASALDAAIILAAKSQTTEGADMTLAIVNPSFENGFASGWTNNGMGIQNNTSFEKVGNNYAEKWQPNGTFSVKQSITLLSAGVYKISAKTKARDVTSAKLFANGVEVNIAVGDVTNTTVVEFACDENITFEFGFEGTGTGKANSWLCVDDFHLTFVGGLPDVTAVEGNMNASVAQAQTDAINTYNGNRTVANYNAASAAIAAAQASVDAYTSAAAAIAAAKDLKDKHNFATAEATTTFADAIAAIENPYNDNTLTTEAAVAAGTTLGVAVSTWHANANAAAVNYMENGFGLTDFDAALYINTWSIEGENDGSNFKVPFYEYYTGNENSLGENTWTGTLTGLENGLYKVSAWVRVQAKNGAEAADATGITMNVNGGEAKDVTEGDVVGQFQLATYEAEGLVKDGTLKVNFNIAADNNIHWLSFKDVKYTKVRDLTPEEAFVAATPEDYAALNAAINARVLGFDEGEYAPYNNVEGVTALAAAKAIDQEANNAQEDVQAATAAITGASWTPNESEVNAVYDGSFEADYSGQSGNINPIGWQRVKGADADGYNVRLMNGSNAGLAATTSGKAIFTKQSAYYGYADGYTMPLKANTWYKVTFVYGGWGDCKKDGYVSMTDPNDALVELSTTDLPVDATNADADVNAWKSYSAIFKTGDAGNYVLGLRKKNYDTSGQSQYAYGDIKIFRATGNDFKEQLAAEIEKAKEIDVTANVGTAAFQIPASAATDLTSAISDAQDIYNNNDATVDIVLQGVEDLKTAEDSYKNVELNAPEEGKLYNVINITSGFAHNGKALTFKSASNADLNANTTAMGWTEVPGSIYPQGVKFTAVDGVKNGYTMSYTRADGNVVYVSTGVTSGLGTDQNQIRPTIDSSKALTVKIQSAGDNVWYLVNTEKGNSIGSNGNDSFYTAGGSNKDVKIQEAVNNEVTLKPSAANKYGTLILPFDAEAPENVTIYSVGAIEGTSIALNEETSFAANTPYIVYYGAEINETVSGIGSAYTDAEYSSQYLTGVFVPKTLEAGTDGMDNYVLQTLNNKQAFYKVVDPITITANRAYLTNESNSNGVKALYFGGEATAINALDALTSGAYEGIYTVDGMKLNRIEKGVNILKMADGTTRKVVVK